MIFRQLIEAWNQHQVLAKLGKTSYAKPEGREFAMDVTKLKLPERGAPSPYGTANRANTSQTPGSGHGK